MKKMKHTWKRLCAISLSSALLVSVMPTLYLPIGDVFAAEETETSGTEVVPSTEETQTDSGTKEEAQTNEAASVEEAASILNETETISPTEETQMDSVAKEEEQTSEAAATEVSTSFPEETEVEVSVEEYAAAPKAGDVAIDSTNFPDENFRKYVQNRIDKNKDNVLSQAEIDSCANIFVSFLEIKSLKGIELFTALTSLDCYGNNLTTLDLSKNTALTVLICGNNNLTTLDVSKSTALTDLQCYRNNLTTLDVSKNTALTVLSCGNNNLTTLDVSKNTALTDLRCYRNNLTTLDVSKNTALTSLDCSNNNLTTLDVSKNTALTSLDCSNNNLTSLDLSKNKNFIVWGAFVYSGNSKATLNLNKNIFDLSTLPNFDVSRVTSVEGGSISGNILTVNPGVSRVNYIYDSKSPSLPNADVSFSLHFDKPATEPDDSQTTPEIPASGTGISYQTHVQTYGWQNPVSNGKVAGTSGQAKRLEGIKVSVSGNPNLGVQYTAHVQSYGWLPWVGNGEFSGTEGEGKRLEAIKIQLTGADKDNYDIYYRVHAQSYGWLNWAKNGEAAGTAGLSKRLEAIQIQIVEKGKAANTKAEGISSVRNEAYITNSGNAPVVGGADAPNVFYKTHIQTYGWQGLKYNGQMSGTSGQAKRLEGICINLSNLPYSGGITYQTHVQTYGWQGWKSNGTMSGTSGQAKRLEAIEIKLTGEIEKHYDVYYRVHAQTYGWMGWAKNGASAGTAGLSKRLEGIQIVLVPKGNAAPANNYGGIVSVNESAFVQK
ncbi:MAG: hypothetical protein HFI63_00800 [Lachnospiraceae bacterium]|nr:hypothetical protein [Lachnospiraceae bacterium]